jgi:acetylornithine deacetylase
LTAQEILRELVGIASPSSVSNVPVLLWVEGFLRPLGWRVELLPYVDEVGVEKANLIARPGDEDGELPARVELAFVCHTDTVPFAVGWGGALALEERDGMLHGCGACDVKGALACFLAAVSSISEINRNSLDPPEPTSQVRDAGHPDLSDSQGFGSVALILTADEEVGCRGMERLLAGRLVGLRIGSAVVSEPTSLRAGIAGKGYGLARVTVDGREAHSAFPGQGISAISAAARLIVRIEEALAGGSEDGLFDPPRTTLNVGVIEGGTAKNIVAGRCSFLVEWRGVPGDLPGRVLGELRRIADDSSRDGVLIRVEGLRDEAGFAPAATGPLRDRLAGLLDGEPIGISFGSEASRLARIADEVIVIGPGNMRTAHSERECVPVAELKKWTAVLRELLSRD